MPITITDPMDGFDLSGAVLPVIGTATGLAQVTVRINGVTSRVNVSGGVFAKTVDIPPSETPIDVTIDAFDGLTFESSTVFSNVVTGQAVNIPPDPPEPGNQWIYEGYETILQSEASHFDKNEEKTVYSLSLDFFHEDQDVPLLCHSQLGVGGLPACIDWWDSDPWPLQCSLHPNMGEHARDTGPMMWPYYGTGRYVAFRIFTSSQGEPEADPPIPINYKATGGWVDFERVRITLSLANDC